VIYNCYIHGILELFSILLCCYVAVLYNALCIFPFCLHVCQYICFIKAFNSKLRKLEKQNFCKRFPGEELIIWPILNLKG